MKKEEASKVKQTTRQSNTAHPRQSLFLRKNELPRVGLEPTTLYTLDRALYQLSYRGSTCTCIQYPERVCRANLPLGVAEDDSLCDGEGVVEVTERVKLPLLLLHRHKELLDALQSQLITAGRGGGRGEERGGGRGEVYT